MKIKTLLSQLFLILILGSGQIFANNKGALDVVADEDPVLLLHYSFEDDLMDELDEQIRGHFGDDPEFGHSAEFLAEFSITASAMDRVLGRSYDLLGLISFFTVGEDEVRAWTIRQDTVAVDAADVIHSDIKKGFIRAEVVAYDDLMEAGSHAEARKHGTVRLEGKTYKVQNGDKIEIITGSQPQPSRDWLSPHLGYLAGGRSRAKVRNWFRQQDRDQHLRQGREIRLAGLELTGQLGDAALELLGFGPPEIEVEAFDGDRSCTVGEAAN